MFGVGEGNFTQDRDFSGVINTGGVFAQGGIEPFKGGTPSAREWFPGDVFVLVLFFHFYPKPSGFGFKENGTIPFYAIFLKKVFIREFRELTRITKGESGKAHASQRDACFIRQSELDFLIARRIGRIADACMKCVGRGIEIGAERQLCPTVDFEKRAS